LSIILLLDPGQPHPPVLEVPQDESKLIMMIKKQNVKIDFFIL
tara:strand:+ start:321 stop:449 length:129 start_codon:yes stop_codon:yes gene_type:complete